MIKTILKYNRMALTMALLSLIPVSCNKDFLEDKPASATTLEHAIKDLSDMNRALIGAYSTLSNTWTFGTRVLVLPDLIADNAFISNENSGWFLPFYNLSWPVEDQDIKRLWLGLYYTVAQSNLIITSKIPDRASLSDTDKKAYDQYLGEAYALRAMAHFTLVDFFAASPKTGQKTPGIPYVTELVDPEHALDFESPRLSLQETYRHIEADLNQALELMDPTKALDATHLSPVAAQLLLSRLYLYNRDWQKAIAAADKAISSGPQILPSEYYGLYWEMEKFQFETVFEIGYTTQLYAYLLPGAQGGAYGQNLAYADLVEAMDAADVRRDLFVKAEDRKDDPKGYYVTKFIPHINLKLLRISEAYLNKIEAEYHTDPTTAAHDLTLFASVRDGVDYSPDTGDQLLADILKERRFEFCFEGHRLFDLRRNEWDIHRGANAIESIKIVNFPSPKYYLPIPVSQVKAMGSKVTQNPGY